MIAAVQSGADVWVQKPISVDVVEGQSMVAAARKHKRVVQVGTQRRSTPHLVEARDQIIRDGKLGKVGLVEIYSYSGGGGGQDPPEMEPPATLDYEMWTGPAPMRPFIRGKHPRGWRQYMEYGNGTLGDMGIHMFDMTRWFLDLGWPRRISSSGGILVKTGRKANIADTQTVIFDYDDLKVVWQHRYWGGPAPDPKYPWGATLYGDKGTLKASVFSYDFTPVGQGQAIHKDVTYELEQYPEDKTEARSGEALRPRHPRAHEGFSFGDRHARQAGGGHRTGPHLDSLLHPRQHGDAVGPDSGVGPRRRARDQGRRGQSPPAPTLPPALDPSRARQGLRHRLRPVSLPWWGMLQLANTRV